MIRPDDIVTCHGNGKYKVISFVSGSRTILEIKDIERGEGWSDYKQDYVGVKHHNTNGEQIGWTRSQNHCYGDVLTIHKKFLMKYEPKFKGNGLNNTENK